MVLARFASAATYRKLPRSHQKDKENHSMKKPTWGARALRLAVMAALAGTFIAAPRFSASASSVHANPPFTIGVSNSLIGNGWRDEMVCSVRAQVKHSGQGHTVVQQTN